MRKLGLSLLACTIVVGMLGACQVHVGPPTAPSATPPAATPPPAPTPAPAVAPPLARGRLGVSLVRMDGNKLRMPGAIAFETGKADLRPESEPVLEQLRSFLETTPTVTLVRIEGHTDNVGQPPVNLKLSGERSQAVKTWLTSHKTDAKRLIAVGFGSDKPVADNKTEEGRAQNRRTEFVVVEMNGKPYQNQDATGGGTVFGDNPRP